MDGSSTSATSQFGMLREVAEEAVERGRNGVQTGDQQKKADFEDVLAGQTLAVHLRIKEVTEQVFTARPTRGTGE